MIGAMVVDGFVNESMEIVVNTEQCQHALGGLPAAQNAEESWARRLSPSLSRTVREQSSLAR